MRQILILAAVMSVGCSSVVPGPGEEQIKMLLDVCGPNGKAGCTFLNGAGATPVLNVR